MKAFIIFIKQKEEKSKGIKYESDKEINKISQRAKWSVLCFVAQFSFNLSARSWSV